MLWCFSYIGAFADERSWESLQLARMAFYTAEREVSNLEPPGQALEYGDYDPLIQAGKDVSFVQPAIEFFADQKESVLIDCQGVRRGLDGDVFWEPALSSALRSVDHHAQIYECQLRYLAVETEYLLLALDDAALAEQFRAFVAENCPRIDSFRVEGDMERQEALATACADDLEALTAGSAQLLGEARALLPLFSAAAESGTLAEDAVQIEGLPVLAPYPGWYDGKEMEAEFSWTGADGTAACPAAGGTLERTADSCILTCPGVTRDGLLAYRDILERCGLSYQLREEGDRLSVTCVYEGGSTLFLLSGDTVRISMDGAPLCFVPSWYWTAQNGRG